MGNPVRPEMHSRTSKSKKRTTGLLMWIRYWDINYRYHMKNNVLDHLTNIHSINIPDLLSGERKSKVMENTFAIGHLIIQ